MRILLNSTSIAIIKAAISVIMELKEPAHIIIELLIAILMDIEFFNTLPLLLFTCFASGVSSSIRSMCKLWQHNFFAQNSSVRI